MEQVAIRGVAGCCHEKAAREFFRGRRIGALPCATFEELFARLDADPARSDKASPLFTLPHTQGSLSKTLTLLSRYGINLTKIQSLPIIGREWEYRFYVDVTFDRYDRYRRAIDAVRPLASEFRILGEYAQCPSPAL